LLSKSVVGAKKGGQELLGALDVDIERNGFGSQVESFEAPLRLEIEGEEDGKGAGDGFDEERYFNGVFIRAPVSFQSIVIQSCAHQLAGHPLCSRWSGFATYPHHLPHPILAPTRSSFA
jgi:glutamine amidotransferase PdxT